MSAPIRVPKVPAIKAEIATNPGLKIREMRAENMGGIKAGKEIPFPGITLAKDLQIIIIKIVAIKTG